MLLIGWLIKLGQSMELYRLLKMAYFCQTSLMMSWPVSLMMSLMRPSAHSPTVMTSQLVCTAFSFTVIISAGNWKLNKHVYLFPYSITTSFLIHLHIEEFHCFLRVFSSTFLRPPTCTAAPSLILATPPLPGIVFFLTFFKFFQGKWVKVFFSFPSYSLEVFLLDFRMVYIVKYHVLN